MAHDPAFVDAPPRIQGPAAGALERGGRCTLTTKGRWAGRARRIGGWLSAHRVELVALSAVLVLTGLAMAWNLDGAPQRIDDEGTYMAEAWAVQHWHTLAPYTYWYDHPPLGWIVIAGWTWVTGAFSWAGSAVYAGRAFMVLIQVVSAALVFVLGRRLRLPVWAAALAALVFSLSPLAIQFHREVYLDNVATPFLLASFIFAATPRRSMAAHAACGICFAGAVLSKETTLIFLPALVWQMWGATDRRTRRYAVAVAMTLMAGGGLLYVLYATLKGELLPGPHHVSLLQGVMYQLASRKSSGSVFAPGSFGHRTLMIWLDLDPWLLGAGIALLPVAAFRRGLRPVVLAYLTGALLVLKPGYLPVPFVIGLLPFASLVVAGGIWTIASRRLPIRASRPLLAGSLRHTPLVGVVAASAVVLAFMVPAWWHTDGYLFTAQPDRPYRQALAWVDSHLPRYDRLLVDDSVWVDLVQAGFPPDQVVWFYKIDTDPAVERRFPQGWRDFQYVISTASLRSYPNHFPDVEKALRHSLPVARFGQGLKRVVVRRVLASQSGPSAGGSTAGRPHEPRR